MRQLNRVQARDHGKYALLILIVIGLGLASRHWSYVLPVILQKNAGDGLWALMAFLLFGLLFPRRSTLRIATAAMLFSAAIEFAKLYRAPWIVALRSTTAGHLVFGSVFTWANLIDYALGIALGAVCEIYLLKGRSSVEPAVGAMPDR